MEQLSFTSLSILAMVACKYSQPIQPDCPENAAQAASIHDYWKPMAAGLMFAQHHIPRIKASVCTTRLYTRAKQPY
jgi:hypothetical protein